jgi:hypothetical protein
MEEKNCQAVRHTIRAYIWLGKREPLHLGFDEDVEEGEDKAWQHEFCVRNRHRSLSHTTAGEHVHISEVLTALTLSHKHLTLLHKAFTLL